MTRGVHAPKSDKFLHLISKSISVCTPYSRHHHQTLTRHPQLPARPLLETSVLHIPPVSRRRPLPPPRSRFSGKPFTRRLPRWSTRPQNGLGFQNPSTGVPEPSIQRPRILRLPQDRFLANFKYHSSSTLHKAVREMATVRG